MTNKTSYLKEINIAFSTSFKHLDDYKNEKNFKSILGQISLDDTKKAISRAEQIENQRFLDSTPNNSYGYKWISKNPSLSVHHVIKKILMECGV